ncbi:MAG TPA: hypothetical protein VMM35_01630 [Longimicrobiales bacterium]|nr:hypothetical protein [Longimicrobiales bacterium]
MVPSCLPLLAAAVLLAVAAPAAAIAQAAPVEAGRAYSGGSSLVSQLTGVSFRLPAGVQAQWEPDVQALVAVAPDLLAGVWAWSEGSAEEVAEEVARLLAAQGIQAQPQGEIEVTGDGLRGDFDAVTADGPGLLHAVVREGPSGGTVAIAALGAPDAATRVRGFVSEVEGSLEWGTPGANSWRAQVQGAVLRWSGSGSDFSPGAVSASGASESSASIGLCGGGQYRYEESSESYVSIMGVSASSSSSDQHAGQWWLVANLVGGATLLLEATDGRYFRWSVEEAGDGYLIDGYRYVLSGSC